MKTPKTLRDCAPREFVQDFTQSLAHKYLDEPAEEMDARINPWPGHHKNVMCWWKLANGYAVGWNENPAVGWSFPLMKISALN